MVKEDCPFSKSRLKRVIILGAGTSGLSVASGLAGKADMCVTILESDKRIGGLSRTITHKGIRFDIGPHRLSPQLIETVDFIKNLIGNDLAKKENIHGVYYGGTLYKYPPKLRELLNPQSLQKTFSFGTSWIHARCRRFMHKLRGSRIQHSFENILLLNFGQSFCKEVIFPMIYKVWGTKDLHADFARIRFLKPTFRMIAAKIFFANNDPNKTFYYPLNGYGQICDSLGEYIKKLGGSIELSARIESIRARSLNGPFTVSYSQNGNIKTLECDYLVSSISNKHLISYFSSSGIFDPILKERGNFSSRMLRLGVMAVKGFSLPVRVAIFPESKFIFNRISEMNKFADLGYPRGEAILLIDVICDKENGYGSMPDEEFNKHLLKAVLSLGWFKEEEITEFFSMDFPDAYPVLNQPRYDSQEIVNRYLERSAIILCGREASSDYNNTHNAMSKGFIAARYILGDISHDEYRRFSQTAGRLPIQD